MTLSTEKSQPYYNAAQEDRCAPRIRLDIPAMLRPSGTTGFAVTVVDLSLAGFACDAVSGMSPRTLCWLTLPGLNSLQATVIWNDGHVIGCAFETLMNQAVMESVVKRNKQSTA